jgi:hypothetical protein
MYFVYNIYSIVQAANHNVTETKLQPSRVICYQHFLQRNVRM